MEKGRACPEFDSDLNLFRDEGDDPGEKTRPLFPSLSTRKVE
jgi:hypothetical protein